MVSQFWDGVTILEHPYMNIHFIAGLPRSGSTLLAAILRQNPRFHAGMTSPVCAMYKALETAMSRRNEAAVFIEDWQRHNVLRGLFTAYYGESDKVIFDTNRGWCAKLPALVQMFPDARVICCVRDLAWIMDSIERLIRKNAFELSGMFGHDPNSTVFSRVNRMAGSDGFVGHALDALKEAYYGEQRHKLILVEYEDLARQPDFEIAKLYAGLHERPFKHDYDNVEYSAVDFDIALGTPGLHTVRPKVEIVPRETILPRDLFDRFAHDSFWRAASPRNSVTPAVHPA